MSWQLSSVPVAQHLAVRAPQVQPTTAGGAAGARAAYLAHVRAGLPVAADAVPLLGCADDDVAGQQRLHTRTLAVVLV